ncbi:MAG: hypothetical protein R3D80_04815, partial [Paracoccaceae bacterium]
NIAAEIANRKRVFREYPGERRSPPFLSTEDRKRIVLKSFLVSIFAWPIMLVVLVVLTVRTLNQPEDLDDEIFENDYPEEGTFHYQRSAELNLSEKSILVKIYWETFVWFFIVIAINYALLYKDGELRFGDLPSAPSRRELQGPVPVDYV